MERNAFAILADVMKVAAVRTKNVQRVAHAPNQLLEIAVLASTVNVLIVSAQKRQHCHALKARVKL